MAYKVPAILSVFDECFLNLSYKTTKFGQLFTNTKPKIWRFYVNQYIR